MESIYGAGFCSVCHGYILGLEVWPWHDMVYTMDLHAGTGQ